MAITKFPNELLETIIAHAIPEGFESLAVTCKRIHALCTPYFQRYQALKLRFRHFAFYKYPYDSSHTIGTAGDLIRRIAAEPVVARYIRSADLKLDSPRSHIIPQHFIQESDCREDILRLFASCPYLKRAGLLERLPAEDRGRIQSQQKIPLLAIRRCFPFDSSTKC